MKVLLKKTVYYSKAGCYTKNASLRKEVKIPFTPFIGLRITCNDGNFDERIEGVYYDRDINKTKVFTWVYNQ